MIGDWIDEHLGWVLTFVVALFVVLLIYSFHQDDVHKQEACRSLLASAHDSHDSLTVRMRCDLADEHQVIPVFIPISTGR